jgi:hypothetical protein
VPATRWLVKLQIEKGWDEIPAALKAGEKQHPFHAGLYA